MKITISGVPGSGKSTLARRLSRKLDYKHYSTGDRWRKLAKQRGISMMELHNIAAKDPSIDKKLDDWEVKLGEDEDNFVLDSRVGFKFIPDSIKIFLNCNPDVAAKRISERENRNLTEVFEETQKRIEIEKQRYKDKYNVDYTDQTNYDLVVDTTNLSIDETLSIVCDFIQGFS